MMRDKKPWKNLQLTNKWILGPINWGIEYDTLHLKLIGLYSFEVNKKSIFLLKFFQACFKLI